MIRTRLTLWNTALFSLTLILLGSLLFVTTRSGLYRAVDDDLNRRASFLESAWGHYHKLRMMQGNRPGADIPRPPRPRDFLADAKNLDPIQAKRLEFNATLSMPRIFPGSQLKTGRTHDDPFDLAALKQSVSGQRIFATDVLMGHRVRVLSVPLREDGIVGGSAQFASDLDDVDEVVHQMGSMMLMMFPLALLATYVLGVQLTNRALRPIQDITEAAERIEASNLGERLPVVGKDEFANLSSRFNQMLGRIETSYDSLERAYQAQRRFVGDASHELKTPLTTIKGRVGLALMKPQSAERYIEHLQAVGRSADTMAAIIQDLLLLARSDEHKLVVVREPITFRELTEEVTHALGPGVDRVEVFSGENLMLFVDKNLFRQVLVNLLTNALRHSGEETLVKLSLIEGRIVVEDQGEGIAPEHVPHLFDRFYRVDESRFRGSGGSGLGLAIVKSIVEAHGGTVTIQSELGVGTRVEIEIPGNAQQPQVA